MTSAQMRTARLGPPHLSDEEPDAVHLGAWDDAWVGVISGVPVSPEGPARPGLLEVIGPFGDHGEALVTALAERLPGGGWLWSSVPCPGLEPANGRWERHSSRACYVNTNIVVLEGVEAVRKRPGMYVGNTGSSGIAALLWELVSNGVDEHLAGHAGRLAVHLGPDCVTVADDGRGFPIEQLEEVCTTLHASSARGEPRRRHVHVGLHGLGLSVVNALSASMVVTVDRGHRWQQTFVRGRPCGPPVDAGPTARRGTTIAFVPDAGIFGDATIDRDAVLRTLADLAVLDPDLRLSLDGVALPSHGGLAGYARTLAVGPVTDAFEARAESDGISVHVAACWSYGRALTRGWANRLPSRGSHVQGLLDGLRETPARGRVALVSVTLDHVVWAGRTRERLQVEAVRELVAETVRQRR